VDFADATGTPDQGGRARALGEVESSSTRESHRASARVTLRRLIQAYGSKNRPGGGAMRNQGASRRVASRSCGPVTLRDVHDAIEGL